jgi:hypothetical protein
MQAISTFVSYVHTGTAVTDNVSVSEVDRLICKTPQSRHDKSSAHDLSFLLPATSLSPSRGLQLTPDLLDVRNDLQASLRSARLSRAALGDNESPGILYVPAQNALQSTKKVISLKSEDAHRIDTVRTWRK